MADAENPLEDAPTTRDGVKIFQGPDGLSELDNPMPRWMAMVFWLTLVWGIGYLVAYPGVGISALGWTQKGMYEAEMAEAKARYQAQAPADPAAAVKAALADPAAAARGKALYMAQCAACHGQAGGGAIGPNLTDATWLYGGTGEAIAHTVGNGTAKGMPPFKSSLSATQIADLAAFVHGLGGGK
jgi:cytochrome c oxidase cbb3-type subunit 3